MFCGHIYSLILPNISPLTLEAPAALKSVLVARLHGEWALNAVWWTPKNARAAQSAMTDERLLGRLPGRMSDNSCVSVDLFKIPERL